MKLILLRHGMTDPWAPNETLAGLSEEGVHDIRVTASSMQRFGYSPTRVISSPMRRCTESARVLIESLGLTCVIATDDRLRPSNDGITSLLRMFKELVFAPEDVVLFSGHNPALTLLRNELAFDERTFDQPMTSGTAACLRKQDARFVLDYFLIPPVFRGVKHGS